MPTDFTRLLEWMDENIDLDGVLDFAQEQRLDPTQLVYQALQDKIAKERIRLGSRGRSGQLDGFEKFVQKQRYAGTSIAKDIERVEVKNEKAILKEVSAFRKVTTEDELDELQDRVLRGARGTRGDFDDNAIIAAAQEERDRIRRMDEFTDGRMADAMAEVKEFLKAKNETELLKAEAQGVDPKNSRFWSVPEDDEVITPDDLNNLPRDLPKAIREEIKKYAQYKRTGRFGGIRDVEE